MNAEGEGNGFPSHRRLQRCAEIKKCVLLGVSVHCDITVGCGNRFKDHISVSERSETPFLPHIYLLFKLSKGIKKQSI